MHGGCNGNTAHGWIDAEHEEAADKMEGTRKLANTFPLIVGRENKISEQEERILAMQVLLIASSRSSLSRFWLLATSLGGHQNMQSC